MSQSNENQRGRKNRAFAAIKTEMEEKERMRKRTRSNKVMQSAELTVYTWFAGGSAGGSLCGCCQEHGCGAG